MSRVVVIGAGASGMAAAITAARDKSSRVILLERQQRVGKKLMSTGNGRCNLTNTGPLTGHYHGENPDFSAAVLNRFTAADTLAFFEGLGLSTTEEYGGRVFPRSNSANSVIDVLRLALARDNIEIRCSCPARRIIREKGGFVIETDCGAVRADRVIVSCGGAAGARVGGVKDGYELLAPLGHGTTELRPALVQLLCEPEYPRALKGVRVQAELSLEHRGKTIARSRGELQFTDRGLSGPASFDISRSAAEIKKGTVHIDMSGGEDIAEKLRRRAADNPELEASECFAGILHPKLGRMTAKYSGVTLSAPLGSLSGRDIEKLARSCRDFAVPLRGTEGFDSAQVTAGGIKTGGVNPKTLESLTVPGLFITGELLDVDGDCGGYNLQWAWASGITAGRLGK